MIDGTERKGGGVGVRRMCKRNGTKGRMNE